MSILQPLPILGAILASCLAQAAADGSVPGNVIMPQPTTYGISIVWLFGGDDDGDARVTVRYRRSGGTWRTGMPLFRVSAGSTQGVDWGNRHLGSLFDLQPASTYEIE